jgi:two-component system CheB/CheR fusion protein
MSMRSPVTGGGRALGRPERSFPIIGLGASAGGLDALQRLLPRIPAGNMALVIVTHLSDAHDSQLAEVLGWATTLPVRKVEGPTRVEPGSIYVIPPGWDLELRQGTLTLVTPGPARPRRPIDVFLRSLAEDWGRMAVGIILSGAGSDGAAGLEAVRACGGATFVQAPETAEFPSMPRHALAYADASLSLEELGEAMRRLVHLFGAA